MQLRLILTLGLALLPAAAHADAALNARYAQFVTAEATATRLHAKYAGLGDGPCLVGHCDESLSDAQAIVGAFERRLLALARGDFPAATLTVIGDGASRADMTAALASNITEIGAIAALYTGAGAQ